jgi:hypothetical protein
LCGRFSDVEVLKPNGVCCRNISAKKSIATYRTAVDSFISTGDWDMLKDNFVVIT